MADSRQPEEGAPQWDPSGGQEPGGTHGANGYSSSAYRTCQPGGAHMATAPYSARENGFNGELTGAHAITAEQVSARIVQEVTAEAVAVLKGEQETQRLPSVEDTTNLPPSPPPSPAAEHFGPLEQEEETMEALTAEYEEEVEEEEESAKAPESEAALDEQQWSGEEPELDSPQADSLEQAEAIDEAQDLDLEPAEAASAAAESSMDREEEEEEEAEGEESPETGVSCPLLSLPACYCIVHCIRTQGSVQHKHFNSNGMASNPPCALLWLQGNTGLLVKKATLFYLNLVLMCVIFACIFIYLLWFSGPAVSYWYDEVTLTVLF
uniref:Microtubule-associated protein 2 n=1 Tax=Amphiprion percula TaxID=161767 RepID=A0A3P8T568_AMPPE